ncbi:MAG: CpaF/VirB11 family protein [Eubacterium sp.]|jgi:pilus assembly protein CpaF|nr:CpaF/VirB11 family protein [Eubacterium sp.]MCH4047477.1 CpaF/VirB11 family protein [Eubacterium sp.]MCI1457422.1 CpaF/VirB11 family protein [Eubacterium sp.]MCI1520490.1 CpaF/VirB11 family protein [Eubacterium sp.]
MNLYIQKEYFGALLPFIENEKITDITWNGKELWVDDLEKGRHPVSLKLEASFLDSFAARIANLANVNFNRSQPVLEAETDNLRISLIDRSVTNTDYTLAIRKTPAVRRLSEQSMIKDEYAGTDVLQFLKAAVKGRCSIIVTGDVGSGKTELVKYLTKHIEPYSRTISIEDNFELRLSVINPRLDCVEMKAAENFSYEQAIKAALRQMCRWMLLSEARGREVNYLLEAASTGCSVMTTIHSDDVRKLPDRIMNMMGNQGTDRQNDIYSFFDIGIRVDVKNQGNGIQRKLSQICILDRDRGVNRLQMLYQDGLWLDQPLPENFLRKLKREEALQYLPARVLKKEVMKDAFTSAEKIPQSDA